MKLCSNRGERCAGWVGLSTSSSLYFFWVLCSFLFFFFFSILFCLLDRSEHGLVGAPREVIITWRHSVEYEWGISTFTERVTQVHLIRIQWISFNVLISKLMGSFSFFRIRFVVFLQIRYKSLFWFLSYAILTLETTVSSSDVVIFSTGTSLVFVPLSDVSVEITCPLNWRFCWLRPKVLFFNFVS